LPAEEPSQKLQVAAMNGRSSSPIEIAARAKSYLPRSYPNNRHFDLPVADQE